VREEEPTLPEGHSLHRLARSLTRSFAGQVVSTTSPQGRFVEGAARLDQAVLTKAEAWGKHLVVTFDEGQLLHVHLGLYGAWVRYSGPVPEPVGALRLRMVGERYYADLRGPTACELLDPLEVEALYSRLGPDPLRKDADVGAAWARISRSRAPIGSLLMDQSVIAGIGNVYRAELLYRHGVSPFTEGRSLSQETFLAMWSDLVMLMKDGVRRGRIVTLDPDDVAAIGELDGDRQAPDDPDLDGGEDTVARRRLRRNTGVYVYRRNGRPCLRCGTAIALQELQGRNLFWCPSCQ